MRKYVPASLRTIVYSRSQNNVTAFYFRKSVRDVIENGKILLNSILNFVHSTLKIRNMSLDTTLVTHSKVKVVNSKIQNAVQLSI